MVTPMFEVSRKLFQNNRVVSIKGGPHAHPTLSVMVIKTRLTGHNN